MITIPLVEGILVIEQEPEGMTLKESKKFIFKVYICLLFVISVGWHQTCHAIANAPTLHSDLDGLKVSKKS